MGTGRAGAGVASNAMPVTDFYSASFLEEHKEQIYAVATVVLALIAARVVDRALSRRGRSISVAVAGGELSPVATTRLRLVRRLVFAGIIILGLAMGLAQFDGVRRLATAILASSAVLGLVVGFAARATLANGVAGVMLAITQPIRIGDLVTFEGQTGEVEDVKLTYTYIRLDDGTRLVVPNERLAQGSIENHTVVDPRMQIEVSVWIRPDADADRAIELIEAEREGITAGVAESDKDGVRLSATRWAGGPRERGPAAEDLRRLWLRRLREHGLSSAQAS